LTMIYPITETAPSSQLIERPTTKRSFVI